MEKNKAEVKKNGSAKLVLKRSQHPVSRKNISVFALRTLQRLNAAGYQAYLVGGGVRDLLLGKAPKDFDVSTNATPEQVRKVLPNSRIIGRRFKIVHVDWGREIIEVTTFRSNRPVPARKGALQIHNDEGMLVRDNYYGKSMEEDAERRDFTINAIYYNLKDFSLIDFHAGLYDLCRGVIDMIGDPKVRYQEDPVRIIRALRFAAKLDFKISRRTAAPIQSCAPLLLNVSNARMYDEINKLFLSGHGLKSLRLLRRFGLFELLFPGLKDFTGNELFFGFIEYALASSDQRYQQQKRNMPHFLYAVLLLARYQYELMQEQQLNESRVSQLSLKQMINAAGNRAIAQQHVITAIPYTTAQDIFTMWKHQTSLLTLDESLVPEMTAQPLFRAAFDIFKLRAHFEPYLAPYVQFWQPHYDESQQKAQQEREKREAYKQKREEKKGKSERRHGGEVRLEALPLEHSSDDTFEKDNSAERNERLARARAWRAAMHLDP